MFWGTEQNSASGGGKDQELDQDKMMVRNLISSIPNRLQAVIDLKRHQINKEDFKSLVIYDLLCKTFMFGNFYVVRNFFHELPRNQISIDFVFCHSNCL